MFENCIFCLFSLTVYVAYLCDFAGQFPGLTTDWYSLPNDGKVIQQFFTIYLEGDDKFDLLTF